VIGNKYIGLSEKSPQEAAEIVGDVDKSNYLAHTIREIEVALVLTQEKHYHILTCESNLRAGKIMFYEHCCEIRLPAGRDAPYSDDRDIRLILAHELGHVIYNFDKLKAPSTLENLKPSDEQEVYAWLFAYHLIAAKSDGHRSDIRRKKFIYEHGDLKRSLYNILKKGKRQTVYEEVSRALGL